MIGIYCLRNLNNGKCYVGQSIDIERRISQHLNTLWNFSCIGDAIREHGKEVFESEVLEICPKSELDAKERYWIAKLDCLTPNGYNVQEGGPSQLKKKDLTLLINNPDITG